MSNLFSQIHTDVKIVTTSKGNVNVPNEVDGGNVPVRISMHDSDGTNVAVGFYDGKKIYAVEDSEVGLRGNVGIKVRINDADGDGKVTLNELLTNARLDGFLYPPIPLARTVEV